MTDAANLPHDWAFALFVLGVFALCAFMLGASSVLGSKASGRSKHDPFESGIVSTGSSRLRLSAKFYLVAMLFVIFDVEIVFLFAWAAQWDRLGWYGIVAIGIFTLFVLETLVYVWKRGALDWNVKRRRRYVRDVDVVEEAA